MILQQITLTLLLLFLVSCRAKRTVPLRNIHSTNTRHAHTASSQSTSRYVHESISHILEDCSRQHLKPDLCKVLAYCKPIYHVCVCLFTVTVTCQLRSQVHTVEAELRGFGGFGENRKNQCKATQTFVETFKISETHSIFT